MNDAWKVDRTTGKLPILFSNSIVGSFTSPSIVTLFWLCGTQKYVIILSELFRLSKPSRLMSKFDYQSFFGKEALLPPQFGLFSETKQNRLESTAEIEPN